ncbi:hypothetical protein COT72_01285 [archaeon CG10_big_fil_rev_8_21_14_0_10_43_11]|nr:MAG: hypothetical protein COT72_01285 [archaeon CG10_big_fil_rev_8_21_14_0_10_43_11]
MPSGIVHSKWSKRLLGRSYSYVHRHMDAPAQGALKWRHRVIRHNPFIHPVFYALKHKRVGAGLACLQHIIQDYYVLFLTWIIMLLVSKLFGFFLFALGVTLGAIFIITFFNFLFEIVWVTPHTLISIMWKGLKKGVGFR